MNTSIPTTDTYRELQEAYDFFNRTLFNSRLPSCLITLQREKRTQGYFSSNRFVARDSKLYTDEIAMNPSYFGICPIEETLSVLVHEMVHLDQEHNGKPGRGRYHNRQWAEWMINIGLYPSSTGLEGGSKTGDQMSHYIVSNGQFDKFCKELMTKDFTLTWIDRFPPVTQSAISLHGGLSFSPVEDEDDALGNPDAADHFEALVFKPIEEKQTRFKFTCPECKTNAWGKKSLVVLCGICEGNPAMIINTETNRCGND